MVFTNMRSKLYQLKHNNIRKTFRPISLHDHANIDNSETLIETSKQHMSLTQCLQRIRAYSKCCVTLLDTAMFLRVERVPFSGRRHLVFRSPEHYSFFRTRLFADLLSAIIIPLVDGKVLSPTDPKTQRVASVARQLGQGMHNVLGLKRDFSIVAYQPRNELVWDVGRQHRKSSDMLFDYSNTDFRRGSTKYLEGREWMVFVADTPKYNAYFTPGNHIVVFTGVLDHCSDEELAFIIGHEMGHSIGRHFMERVMLYLPKEIIRVVIMSIMSLNSIFHPHSKPVLKAIFNNFLGRRREYEADHIGMLLMASAGYDPQTAPTMLSSAGHPINELDVKQELTSSHPSHCKRAEYLRNPRRMNVAMNLYKYVKLTQNNLIYRKIER